MPVPFSPNLLRPVSKYGIRSLRGRVGTETATLPATAKGNPAWKLRIPPSAESKKVWQVETGCIALEGRVRVSENPK